MSGIKIERPPETKLAELDVKAWPIWEKEPSKFDWYYDEMETCFILDGRATVSGKDFKTVSFGKGDLVVFPKGLKCVWEIQENIRKHYKFG